MPTGVLPFCPTRASVIGAEPQFDSFALGGGHILRIAKGGPQDVRHRLKLEFSLNVADSLYLWEILKGYGGGQAFYVQEPDSGRILHVILDGEIQRETRGRGGPFRRTSITVLEVFDA